MEKLKNIKQKIAETTKQTLTDTKATKATDSLFSHLSQLKYSGDSTSETTQTPDLICLSHLRWDFVYQRPQHLLSRAAKDRRVFFVEEPIFGDTVPRLDISSRD